MKNHTPGAAFIDRREKLARRLYDRVGECIALIGSNPEQQRSNDTFFHYRQNSHLLYLTGFSESKAVLLMRITARETHSQLFIAQSMPDRVRWDGPVASKEEALASTSVDQVDYLEDIPHALEQLRDWKCRMHAPNPTDHAFFTSILGAKKKLPASTLEEEISSLRLVKDVYEIGLLSDAARISADAHRRAMATTEPGVYEYQLQAEIEHEFMRNDTVPGYASIVAGGANGCVLHWIKNCDRIGEEDMVLIDAGCEVQGYSADITRTWPARAFTPAQRALYDAVLVANKAVIDACKPGLPFTGLQEIASRSLTEGLVELDLLSGSVDELVEKGAYKRFYMHSVSHWLGLDVHDVGGKHKSNGEQHSLAPGHVLTVEPGLYIDDGDDIPPEFHHQAVRIEDDVLITAAGNRVLTDDITKSPDEIEALVGSAC